MSCFFNNGFLVLYTRVFVYSPPFLDLRNLEYLPSNKAHVLSVLLFFWVMQYIFAFCGLLIVPKWLINDPGWIPILFDHCWNDQKCVHISAPAP